MMEPTQGPGPWSAVFTGIALGVLAVIAVNAVAIHDLNALQRSSNLAVTILVLGLVSCFLSGTRAAFYSGLATILVLEVVNLIRWHGIPDGLQVFFALGLPFEESAHSANVYFFLGCGAFGSSLTFFREDWRRAVLLFAVPAALLLLFVWLSNGIAVPQPEAWSDQPLVVRHFFWAMLVLVYFGAIAILARSIAKRQPAAGNAAADSV